tara:strand:+ start:88142 stop:88357 length:216 start_codon:yes stop_codon:yes gene_type:complete
MGYDGQHFLGYIITRRIREEVHPLKTTTLRSKKFDEIIKEENDIYDENFKKQYGMYPKDWKYGDKPLKESE